MSVGQQDRDQNAGESGWQPQPQSPVQPKKRHRLAWAIVIALTLIAVVSFAAAISAGTGEKTAAPVATPSASVPESGDPGSTLTDEPTGLPVEEENAQTVELKLGRGLAVQGNGKDIGEITVSKLRIVNGPGYSYGDPPKNGHYLIFTVKAKSHAPEMYVDESEFYVLTPDGQHVDSSDGNAYMAIEGDTIGYTNLGTGEHRNGFLTFDSPSKHGKLVYSPNYEGDPVATWSF